MKVHQEAGEEEKPPPLPPKQHVRFGLFLPCFYENNYGVHTVFRFTFHLLSLQLSLQMHKCVIVISIGFCSEEKNYALFKRKRFLFLVEVSDNQFFHIMSSFVAYLKGKFKIILQIV